MNPLAVWDATLANDHIDLRTEFRTRDALAMGWSSPRIGQGLPQSRIFRRWPPSCHSLIALTLRVRAFRLSHSDGYTDFDERLHVWQWRLCSLAKNASLHVAVRPGCSHLPPSLEGTQRITNEANHKLRMSLNLESRQFILKGSRRFGKIEVHESSVMPWRPK